MYALIDCNSFYASCEKLFRPDLKNKPVIVLSNNDGCVVARSQEAKDLGIGMAVPFFQVKEQCTKKGVHYFSSNYALYADMSQRVMSTLESLCPFVDVYSIDEAFLYVADYPKAMQDLNTYGEHIKKTIYQNTGIPVGVGMGATKTLAKLANYASKKHPATKGVCVLDKEHWLKRLMHITPVGEVWGIGNRTTKKLNAMGVVTIEDFVQTPVSVIRKHFNVVLERTWRELHGQPCLAHEDDLVAKKQIVSSRSFSQRITSIDELRESLCGHVAHACHKLRKQNSKCTTITFFARSSVFDKRVKPNNIHGSYCFDVATNDTFELCKAVNFLLETKFQDNVAYAKAGIMLCDICDESEVQTDLFSTCEQSERQQQKSAKIMGLLDTINHTHSLRSNNKLFVASAGIANKQSWQMSRDHISPSYTTNINDILVVK